MIKQIPTLIECRIERDSLLEKLYEQQASEKAPFQKENEATEAKRKAVLLEMQKCCAVFRGTCPEEWKTFIESFTRLYGICLALDRRTPMDFIGIQEKAGVSIDSNYWALNKAFLQGQMEVTDSIATTLEIPISKIVEAMESKPKNSFLKKLLTFWK